MSKYSLRQIFGLLLLISTLLSALPAVAQQQSVNPGINKAFESPNPTEYIERFEREGRDIFDRRQEIVRECQLKPGMTVADIGAGTGLFTRMFANAVGGTGKVYAVDISKEFVRHIEETAKSEGLTNVVGVVCPPDSVGLLDDTIDLAFICDVYHHFEFPQRTLGSLYRAMKPKGNLILIDFVRVDGVSSAWTLSHVRAGQEVFANEIVDAGFRQINERKDLLRESYFVRFEKVPEQAR